MRSLPRIVSKIPNDLRNFLDRVREYMSEGGEERFVTLRELKAGGIVGTTPAGTVEKPTEYGIEKPNMPTGLTTTGGLGCVFVEWDEPNYLGHLHTEVWGASTNVFANAVLLGTAPGLTYVDNVGSGASRYYWIRFVNKNEVAGAFNSDTGTLGTAGTDPAYILNVLTGSITSSQLSTALNTTINTNTTQITNVRNLYTVKMDNQGYLTGFGLMSTLADGGVPTTDFFVNANRFAVTTPTTSIPSRTNSTAYAVGAFVGVASSTSKMLVCKIAGTSGGSAPDISATAIGALVTDGSVTWQVASRVPLSVMTTSATINGVSVTPGVYIDGASIVNATITNATIADAAITSAKINDLSADKITAGNIQTGYIRSTSYTAGASGWSINADGSANFYGNLLAGSATAYVTGIGLFSGFVSGTYKWRVGNPTGARIEWTGTAVEVYNSSNVLTLSSGGVSVSYADITGTKPPIDATRNVVYRQTTAPTSGMSVNDIWFNTTTNITYYYNGTAWVITNANTITGQGAFATLSQITSANVSTYIASAAIGNAQIGNAAITNAKIGNLEVDSAKIANLTVGTGKITDNAVSQLVSSNSVAGYPTVFSTAGTFYTFPSFTVPAAGLLVITITSVFHNFSTTSNLRIQAMNFVNNASGVLDPPIHFLSFSVANATFIPVGPTPATTGSSATYTSQEIVSVTAGQSISIDVDMYPGANNSSIYLLDSYYTAVLYKK